ncbi:MAG TPA: hypothetical protein V6D17_10750 [Candidatus Obscuribacterales bacterium]
MSAFDAPFKRPESESAPSSACFETSQYQVGCLERLPLKEPESLVFASPYQQFAEASRFRFDTRAGDARWGDARSGDLQKPQEYNLRNFVDRRMVPDATIYVPSQLDPSQPINVILYNHGWRDTSNSAMTNARLREQMAQAPPNSMLIVPAWQKREGAESSVEDQRFTNNFLGMLDGALRSQRRGLGDIASFSIVSHSAGYKPVERELAAMRGTPLYDRIKTVANLDTNYSSNLPATDAWIAHNIRNGRFAAGQASFLNLYGAGTDTHSRGQASRVAAMLRQASENPAFMGSDIKSPIVFQKLDIPHAEFPRRFFGSSISRRHRS